MEFNLRKGQKEIVAYQGGMMAVPAVPGAGKTYTLACLAARLIAEEQLEDGKILIVTYMNSAVANFRQRIDSFLEQLGVSSSKDYQVKTLHSLAMNILKERPGYLLINEDFELLTEGQQKEIIAQLANNWLENNRERWHFLLSDKKGEWYQRAVDKWQRNFSKWALNTIKYLKGRGVGLKQAQKLLDHKKLADDSFLSFFLELFIEYNEYLSVRGQVDFDDLIYNAWRLLNEDQQLRVRLSKQWDYIFEDEAQDSNPIQEEILKLLAANNNNLLRVGDSNQAIMGTFTLADPKNFRSFSNRDDVEQGAILVSSRSTKKIIDLANYLVKWTREHHPVKKCRSALEEQLINPVASDDPVPNPVIDDYGIDAIKFDKSGQELAEVVAKASEYSQKYPDDTIAILAPNRYVKSDLIDLLEQEGSVYEEIKGINRSQENTIELLEDLLYFLAWPHRQGQFKEVLTKHLLKQEINSELINKLLAQLTPGEILYPVGEELPVFSLPEGLYENQDLFAAFKAALDRLRYFLDAAMELAADELVLFLAEEFQFESDLMALAQGISLHIKDLLKENPNWGLTEIMQNLEELKPSILQLAKKISESEGFEIKAGVINVLTTHKAKGLEWDMVFLTSLTADQYPSCLDDKFQGEQWYLPDDRSNPTALAKAEADNLLAKNSQQQDFSCLNQARVETISERIRLLYVAITRAKKRLLFSTHQKRPQRDGGYYSVEVSKLFTILRDYIKKEQSEYETSTD